MSRENSSKTDLMYEINYNPEFIPVPSSKVSIMPNMVAGGKTSYLMKNHATGIYYDIDELTNLIWTLTDGKRTVKEIVAEAENRNPKVKEDDVIGLLLFFADANLLVSSLELKKKRLKVISSFQINYALIEQSNKFLQSIYNKLRPVFKRPLLWATVIFIITAAALFAGRFVSIFGRKSNFQILGSSVVGFFFYFFVALAPVIAIHEISHGLALVHGGGEPGEMGTGLFYFGPMFYTDTTDAYSLKKRQRIMVGLAGNISTLLIGSIVVFILLFITFPQPAELIVTMVAFYCFDLALINFAPAFETDGYGILTDALNMPNLRHESYEYVGSLIKRVFGAKKLKATAMTRHKKGIMVGYTMLSVGWIIYLVFQTGLFLTYMSQDFTVCLSKILHAIWTSQALSAAAVVIAVLSVVYFGMQVLGYGWFFFSASKKAFKKPVRIEAIHHNRTLSVFAYLPPQAPESLANNLRSRMEKTAKKFTHNFEIRQAGRSCIAVLRMGGANLAFTQIENSLKRVEDEFSAAYEKLILSHKAGLQKSIGINSPAKMKLTRLLEHGAAESVSSGDSGALAVAKACEEKQKEAILYLLTSAFGTVWTIEVQPADEYEIQKEIVPAMLLEDLTLTDLYGDCENFKKRTVYGFDSLAELAEETEIGLKKSLAQPQEYQAVCTFQPIKSRITFVGRTEQLEKKLHIFAPYFVAETWSGYLDNLLTETSYTLYTLNKVRPPEAREIKEMSTGELTVLANDLSELGENQEFVEKCIQGSENTLSRLSQSLLEVRDAIKPSDNFEVGLLDATFNVNLENLEALPGRIKDFRNGWKAVCKEVDRIKKHVEDELEKRKAETDQRKHKVLKVYPAIMAISVLLAALGFLLPFATLWIPMLSIALIAQALYWVTFYRTWTSFHRVSKYPSEAFSRIHLLTLAWTEAVYAYVTTGDILAPV